MATKAARGASRTAREGGGGQPRPSDDEIRPELRTYLRARHAGEPDTVVLEELGLQGSTARADLAVVNGILHGYEIKSDRDSLRRLHRQVPFYSAIFDRVTLVVGGRFGRKVEQEVPDWWGILDVAHQGPALQLHSRREGEANPHRAARALVELLWRDSALRLLDLHGQAKGFRARPRCEVWDRLCEVCTIDEIAEAVRDDLKATPGRGSAPTSA